MDFVRSEDPHGNGSWPCVMLTVDFGRAPTRVTLRKVTGVGRVCAQAKCLIGVFTGSGEERGNKERKALSVAAIKYPVDSRRIKPVFVPRLRFVVKIVTRRLALGRICGICVSRQKHKKKITSNHKHRHKKMRLKCQTHNLYQNVTLDSLLVVQNIAIINHNYFLTALSQDYKRVVLLSR